MDATQNNKSHEQIESSQQNLRTDLLRRLPCVPVAFDKNPDGTYHVYFGVGGANILWLSHQPSLELAQTAYDQAVQIAQLYALLEEAHCALEGVASLIDANGRLEAMGNSDQMRAVFEALAKTRQTIN